MKTALLIVRRFGAFAFDWLVFLIGSFPIVLYFWFGGIDEPIEAYTQTILVWAWLAYFVAFEWFYGATIGKFVFRLTVQGKDRTRISLMTALARTGLTFVIPCVLSVFIPAFNSTNFAEYLAETLGAAILAVVPLSIIAFKGQSVADVLLHTYVTPVAAIEKPALAPTRKRWLLVVMFSLLVGVVGTWIMSGVFRMMYGTSNPDEASRRLVDTFPPELMPSDRPEVGVERKIMMDIRGNFVRQPKGHQYFGKDFTIHLYGSATSYDELLIARRIASSMAELPDEDRPKCVTVKFIKDFEAVMFSVQQQHEMAICDVPKGLPYQATLIDHNLAASLQFEFNADHMLSWLIGQSGSPIRRFVAGKRRVEHH